MSNSTQNRPCVARVHLRGSDFAVYDAVMALTAHSGGARILSASRETLSRMTGYGLRTIGFSRERLVAAGWLVPLTPGDWQDDQRRKSGKGGSFAPPKFEVVTHDKWALVHPGQCSTVVGSTAHGQSVDGNTDGGLTAHGKAADTVDGRTADTVHGRTDHNALYRSLSRKPAHNPGRLVCSRETRNPFEYAGVDRIEIGVTERFLKECETVFSEYRNLCDGEECGCAPVDFLEMLLDRCRSKKIRYPRKLLGRLKDLEQEERKPAS
jgi:hypothetical protein